MILEGYFAFSPEFYKDKTGFYLAEVCKFPYLTIRGQVALVFNCIMLIHEENLTVQGKNTAKVIQDMQQETL